MLNVRVACLIVRDANRYAFAYVFDGEPGQQSACDRRKINS
jgi:hypothetical protein